MIDCALLTPGSEPWLKQAVVISVFTDAFTRVGDGGHWGDLFLPEGDSMGSQLYRLKRHSITPDVINQANDFLKQSLAWLQPTWCQKIDTQTWRASNNTLGFLITLHISDTQKHSWEFNYALK